MRVSGGFQNFGGKRCPEKGMHHARPVMLG